MLAGYFDTIPRELDEAALVDGCGPLGALWRVVLPAARPGVIAVAIYSFMTAWGEVLFASVMTTEANRTLSVGLRQYSTQTNIYWNQIMAAALVVSVPVVIGFLLAQRHFVAGVTAASKGRPVTAEQIEQLSIDLEDNSRLQGNEITSAELGLEVLERLRSLDVVAYLRFASVYKNFDAAADFQRELVLLKKLESR